MPGKGTGTLGFASLLAVSVCIGSASAAEATTVDEPARVEAVRITGRGPGSRALPTKKGSRARDHSFTFARDVSPCSPISGSTLQEVTLRERPITKTRPYRSAVITAIAYFPARTRTLSPTGIPYEPICPPVRRTELHVVTTKRLASELIFYDGSSDPPRRIWPPVGTPPSR